MQPTSVQQTSDITLLRATWRRKWLILLWTLAVAAGAFVYASIQPQVHEGVAVIEIKPGDTSQILGDGAVASELAIRDRIEIIGSEAVAQQTVVILADGEPAVVISETELLSGMSATGSSGSALIHIAFTSESPEEAVLVANTIALAYEDVLQIEAQRIASDRLALIDEALRTTDEQLTSITLQIDDLQAQNETLIRLEEQAAAALAELAVLQDRLARAADPETQSDLRTGIADLDRQLQRIPLVRSVAASSPELGALERDQASALERRSTLLSRQTEIQLASEFGATELAFPAPATSARPTFTTGPSRAVAVGIILGALSGAGMAYLFASRRRTIVDRREPERLLEAPLLAEVPDFSDEGIRAGLPVWEEPRSATAEAFRFAAVTLDIQLAAYDHRSVAWVSPTQGNGKTTLVANTAIAAARDGSRVLVVDADFGNQSLTQILSREANFAQRRGITDIADPDEDIADAVQDVILGEGTQLHLLSRGTRPVIAADFFRSHQAAETFRLLANQYDLVLVDTPPLLQVAYASTLVGHCDAVVLVIEHDSQVANVETAANRLRIIGKPVAGYVLNRVPLRRDMTESEGSMADILGDQGVKRTRRRRVTSRRNQD